MLRRIPGARADDAMTPSTPPTSACALPASSRRGGLVSGLAAALLLAACGSTPTQPDFANWPVERLYDEARDESKNNNWERATQLYGRLESKAAGTQLAQQAQLDLAYAHWKNGQKPEALAVLDRFISLNPSSPALDYAYYLQGLVHFNEKLGLLGSLARQDLSERDQQASRDAYQSFRQVVTLFPSSRYAADASLRLNYILNTLALYEVHVARYYARRGAWVAAVNRAQQAVTEFQNAPAVEEALYIMVLGYDALKLPELRDDTRRVLTANFPDSAYLSQGLDAGEVKKRPWWQLW